jgi:hypothetical protein
MKEDEKEEENTKDPLEELQVAEPRHLTSSQRLEMKRLISRVAEQRIGWLFDQRSIFTEKPTTDDIWTAKDKRGNITSQKFLQTVIRPEVKTGKVKGLLLYHRYVKKGVDSSEKEDENRKLEDDGVVKLLNQKQNRGLSTPWVATAWRDSEMSKHLKSLFTEVTAEHEKTIKENETKRNPKVKRVRRSPF